MVNVKEPEKDFDVANKSYVDKHKFDFDMKNNKLINLAEPVEPSDAATKKFCNEGDDEILKYILLNVAQKSDLDDVARMIKHVTDPQNNLHLISNLRSQIIELEDIVDVILKELGMHRPSKKANNVSTNEL